MARAVEEMEGVEASRTEEMGESMMQEIMNEFGKLSEKVRKNRTEIENACRCLCRKIFKVLLMT